MGYVTENAVIIRKSTCNPPDANGRLVLEQLIKYKHTGESIMVLKKIFRKFIGSTKVKPKEIEYEHAVDMADYRLLMAQNCIPELSLMELRRMLR